MDLRRRRDLLEVGLGLGLLFFVGLVVSSVFQPYQAQEVTPVDSESARLPKVEVVEVPPPPPPPAEPPKYPFHTEISTTMFWVGEPASEENGWIANDQSFWDVAWQEHFGGVDDPNNRNGYQPASFTSKENPFYVALPYAEYAGHQPKENADRIYWYQPFAKGTSLLKNKWVKITAKGKTVYGQWEDVGPFATDDVDYVFGTARPQASVGLDVSPAIRDYLGFGGKTTASWQFVDAEDVPGGPWKEIVTTSGISW